MKIQRTAAFAIAIIAVAGCSSSSKSTSSDNSQLTAGPGITGTYTADNGAEALTLTLNADHTATYRVQVHQGIAVTAQDNWESDNDGVNCPKTVACIDVYAPTTHGGFTYRIVGATLLRTNDRLEFRRH